MCSPIIHQMTFFGFNEVISGLYNYICSEDSSLADTRKGWGVGGRPEMVRAVSGYIYQSLWIW